LFGVILSFLAFATHCSGLVVVVAALAHPVSRPKIAREIASGCTSFPLAAFATRDSDGIVVIAART